MIKGATTGQDTDRQGDKPALLLDISRLIWRAQRVGPTGIDRIELAYAQHFLLEQKIRPVYAVLHLFGFLFAVSAAGGRRFTEDVSEHWRGLQEAHRERHAIRVLAMYLRLFVRVWIGGWQLQRRFQKFQSSPIFLVVSNHHISRGYTIRRIRRTFAAKTVCFVHDLLPIDFPEYFESGSEQRHHRQFDNVGRLFDAAIANSISTGKSLEQYLAVKLEATTQKVKICVAPPGVRPFPTGATPCATATDRPYFVVLGTIEPRKNHLLLLNLWSRMASLTPRPPRLIVIGARGWENEQVVDMLERSRRLRGLVEEHNQLTDGDIGSVLKESRALLLPSLAEGFGLPLAEALATGIPVICSDIPVFREIGRDVPEYRDPLDLFGWLQAVLEYSALDSPQRAAQMQRLDQWSPPTWTDHFETVECLLDDLNTC